MRKAKWLVALLCMALVVGLVALIAVSCEKVPDTTTTVSTDDPGGDVELRLSTSMPLTATLYVTALQPWMDAIEEASDGRVKWTVYDENTLVSKETDQVEACRSLRCDIVAFQPSWESGGFPLLELAGQPMLFPDSNSAVGALTELIEEYGLAPEGNPDNETFKVLGLMMISPAQWGGIIEAKTPADLEGKRIRSGGVEETSAIQALGATPVEVETPDLPLQISNNAFDGAFMSWSFHGWMTMKWATHWTETNAFLRPIALVINTKTWNNLPEAVRQVIEQESTVEKFLAFDKANNDYQLDNSAIPGLKDKHWDKEGVLERAAKLGTEVYQLTAADRALWKEAFAPVIQEWVDIYAAKIPTQEILDALPDYIAKYETAETGEDASATDAE